MKNNQYLKNIVFDIVDKEHDKFIYNDAALLLAIIIIDGALFRFEPLDDLRRQ
jgi:molybdopterin/thiamine biosynthesis adenylyltransferase